MNNIIKKHSKFFKKNFILLSCIILSIIISSCSTPYNNDDILCEYDDFNCLYYTKDVYKKYKYSDYIFDDISNGIYKLSSPSISDYRTGNGILDYDIPSYVNAKMDYAIKVDLIDKYEMRIDNICGEVYDGYFEQRNSLIYFYDKNSKKSKLLSDKYSTNISYDDELPSISFDIDDENNNENSIDDLSGRRIMLSDIIAANSTIDGYMKVILGKDKKRIMFFMDKRVDNDTLFDVASVSSINLK